jgi:hypothetical protein
MTGSGRWGGWPASAPDEWRTPRAVRMLDR